MTTFKKFVLVGVVAGWSWSVFPLVAQTTYYQVPYQNNHSPYHHHHSPFELISSRIYAQAAIIRARGAAAIDYATAREIRARAVRLEIANSVERVKAYWEKRSIGEAERLKRAYNHLDSHRLRNNRSWERIKNHPDLIGISITNGTALNFLLNRLSGSVLAFKFSQDARNPDDNVKQQLQISRETLHALSLRQRLSNGRHFVFRADEGKPLDIGWWPYFLRNKEFNSHRDEFTKLREQAIAEAQDGTINDQTLVDLNKTFLDLSDEFHQYYNKAKRHEQGMSSWSAYKRGDLFLKSLWGEIGLLQSTGDIDTLDAGLQFEPGEKGGNLLDVLLYMSRNGLEFAPAKPQDSAAYYRTFAMMRDLYINIAEEDESLQPQTEKYQDKLNR
jgi:hypothetical protein